MNPLAGGLSDYFPFVFPDGDGAVSVISGYFDESERDEKGAPICLGGFLFKPSGYKRFSRYWQSHVLKYRGRQFRHFHMTDLCAGHGEYKGLTIPERLELLDHATRAVADNMYGAIAVYFDRTEFERKAPPEWPIVFGSIYTVACSMCLQVTAHWLKDWRCQMNVVYVFERGHKFQGEADELMSAIAANTEWSTRFKYRQHMFEPKAEVGLQAADMFAWIITKALVSDGTAPRAVRAFVKPIHEFTKRLGTDRCKLVDFVGWRLDKFLSDSVNGETFLYKKRTMRPRSFR